MRIFSAKIDFFFCATICQNLGYIFFFTADCWNSLLAFAIFVQNSRFFPMIVCQNSRLFFRPFSKMREFSPTIIWWNFWWLFSTTECRKSIDVSATFDNIRDIFVHGHLRRFAFFLPWWIVQICDFFPRSIDEIAISFPDRLMKIAISFYEL